MEVGRLQVATQVRHHQQRKLGIQLIDAMDQCTTNRKAMQFLVRTYPGTVTVQNKWKSPVKRNRVSQIATPSSPTTMTTLHIEYAKAMNAPSDTWITRGLAIASRCFAGRGLTEGFGGSIVPAVAGRAVPARSLTARATGLWGRRHGIRSF